MTVTIGLAFLAGLASFLSPCVIALIPAYIGYLSGRSAYSLQQSEQEYRFVNFFHGCAFVLGFSLVFVLSGIAVSAASSFLNDIQWILAKVGGVIVIIFGLHIAEVIHLKFLDHDLRPKTPNTMGRSLLASGVMGVFFSAGWSPCLGPVLGAILTVVMTQGSIGFGVKMLSAYSAGLAVPFLIAGFGVGWVTTILRRYQKLLHIIQVVMGLILVLLGIAMLLDLFQSLARFGLFIDFGI